MTTMIAPEYRFVSRWWVLGTVEEVAAVLADLRELARWWPSVFLDVEELEPGGEDGIGRRARLHTKAWFPYTLYLQFRVVESRHPHGFSINATGDLEGRGDWTFEEAGAWTLVTHDCSVRIERPLLRLLAPILRPVLAANQRWAMRMGEESLALELARRRVHDGLREGEGPGAALSGAGGALPRGGRRGGGRGGVLARPPDGTPPAPPAPAVVGAVNGPSFGSTMSLP